MKLYITKLTHAWLKQTFQLPYPPAGQSNCNVKLPEYELT